MGLLGVGLKIGPARIIPGNFSRVRTLRSMIYENRAQPPISSQERAEKVEKRRLDAEQALKERKEADDAFRANYERLKAERLEREAKK